MYILFSCYFLKPRYIQTDKVHTEYQYVQTDKVRTDKGSVVFQNVFVGTNSVNSFILSSSCNRPEVCVC